MSKYQIEIESTKNGVLYLSSDNAQARLLLEPGLPDKPSRMPLTAEQFEALAYDIEGHSCGKYGVEKDLTIWSVNLDTNERESVSFALARQAFSAGVNDDSAALAVQNAKAQEHDHVRQPAVTASAVTMQDVADEVVRPKRGRGRDHQ